MYSVPDLKSLLSEPPAMAQLPGQADNRLSDDSRVFLACWNRWRGTRLLPRRADMDITSIARLMPRILLLEISGPDRMVFRLAGTEIEQHLGRRLQGHDYLAMVAPDRQPRRAMLMWRIVNQPCAAMNTYRITEPNGEQRQIQICGAPILADEPDAPIQWLAVVSNLRRLGWGEAGSAFDPSATRLHLIDIGAGLPQLGS
ncbi:PAS domain-containing protein [Ferrovibrio sp.]|uniref:PAS domain-containing protein n=1 Tax=Ferrovibrio sp. TaxID=1917215 RepID=UPI0026271390|nr:PAS domain-containing protein [Ferrovibrio sp.]